MKPAVPPLLLLVVVLAACDVADGERDTAGESGPDELAFGDLTIPPRFENLQVLPETIGRKELVQNMRSISRALGVRCKYCHDMQTEDYAADDYEEKRKARDMMRLVERLNRDFFTWDDAPDVTCWLCHRGDVEPETALPATTSAAKAVKLPEPRLESMN